MMVPAISYYERKKHVKYIVLPHAPTTPDQNTTEYTTKKRFRNKVKHQYNTNSLIFTPNPVKQGLAVLSQAPLMLEVGLPHVLRLFWYSFYFIILTLTSLTIVSIKRSALWAVFLSNSEYLTDPGPSVDSFHFQVGIRTCTSWCVPSYMDRVILWHRLIPSVVYDCDAFLPGLL